MEQRGMRWVVVVVIMAAGLGFGQELRVAGGGSSMGRLERVEDQLEAQAERDPLAQQRIVLWTDTTEAARDAAWAAGVTGMRESDGWVDGFANRAVLERLAKDARIRFVQAPPVARTDSLPSPSSVGEGIGLSGAGVQHLQGNRGNGVKVCVIDVEFGQYQNGVNAGILPNGITTQSFVPAAGGGMVPFEVAAEGNHGTSCLKIVHDMAPQAQLYAARVATRQDLAAATTWALQQGCRIVSGSIGWTAGNFWSATAESTYTTVGAIHQVSGLPVFAAGNERQRHQEGVYADVDTDGNMDWPGIGNALPVEVAFTGPGNQRAISVELSWDGFPTTPVDYDLELRTAGGALLDSSTNRGNVVPTESIDTTLTRNPAPAAGVTVIETVHVHVKLFNLPAGQAHRRLKVFLGGCRFANNAQLPAGSLNIPACLPEAFAVGALHVENWPNGFIADYSSCGPTAFDPGRSKPEMVAPSNVLDPWYASGRFNGTSAATPHVAGAAALLVAMNPASIQPNRVGALRSLVLGFADSTGLPVPTPTFVYGLGRLRLPQQVLNGYTGACIAVPAVPRPGQAFTIFVTGGDPLMPLTVAVDLTTTTNGGTYLPLCPPCAALHGNLFAMIPLVDGLGVFNALGLGNAPPAFLDVTGSWFLPMNRPMPGLGLNGIHLQAAWISPMGLRLATPLVIDL